MNAKDIRWAAYVLFVAMCSVVCAADHYVSPFGGHVSPFTSWATAATNIQAAIDDSSSNDVIWVTNGVYSTSGKVMAGDLTNRVALDKAVTVQSINGPWVTMIQGQWDSVGTNGAGAVRCAWLTNGAVLNGFTLRGGATRTSGDLVTLLCGGGAWCMTTNAVLVNCIVSDNFAFRHGGGAFRGKLDRCTVQANLTVSGEGGGGYSNLFLNCLITGNAGRTFGGGAQASVLYNCAVTRNSANDGGGAYNSIFRNCTVTGNQANQGGGVSGPQTIATNTIIWNNTAPTGPNYIGGNFRACCATPLPPGTGNIATDPQLLADGIHISSNSPCRNVGVTIATGTDIDGQSWNSPPAIGCDEWQAAPAATAPAWLVLGWGKIRFSALGVGAEPLYYQWLKDGVPVVTTAQHAGANSSDLLINSFGPDDVGLYRLVVSNTLGSVTSRLAGIVVRCVDARSGSAVAPYTTWATAAATIQDAVEVSLPRDLILVTNGIYASGGKVKFGDLTNRVALEKAVIVMSSSGPEGTIIQGQWDHASTNGTSAIRCAWVGDGAALVGFTLRGGATRASGDVVNLQSGGGVWCASTNGRIISCLLVDNAASRQGGGAYNGTLNNCLVKGNSSYLDGGGTYVSVLYNCTVNRNWAGGAGAAGVWSNQPTNGINNCIIWNNIRGTTLNNYSSVPLNYCCTFPLPSGPGNISADPQFQSDETHLLFTSPCRGAASSLYGPVGLDIDGQSWTNPASMGCDEWLDEPAVGAPRITPANPGKLSLSVSQYGQPPFGSSWLKDGNLLADGGRYGGARTAKLIVSGFGPSDAGEYRIVTTNVSGVVTSLAGRVVVRCVDMANAVPATPFTNWTTAAATIHDALDAADIGDVILVTNGLFSTGGRVMAGDLTNRLVVDKAVTIMSVNGPEATIIQGEWDPVSTNGPAAVRCAWISSWATVSGFSLRNGATRSVGDDATLRSGGGILGGAGNGLVLNCVVSNNAAARYGGGSRGGFLHECTYQGNTTFQGGAAFRSTINNCVLKHNAASNMGGGVMQSSVYGSLIMSNSAPVGGGSAGSVLRNCNIIGNNARGVDFGDNAVNCIVLGNAGGNFGGSLVLDYSCTSPLTLLGFPIGTSNILADPQFIDSMHISSASLCRGVGNPLVTSGVDIDGERWLNPPSMGCDEIREAALTGPLSVAIQAAQAEVATNQILSLNGVIMGRSSHLEWSFGDGPAVGNLGYQVSHAWTDAGDYPVTLTAFNADYPGGVSSNLVIHVFPLVSPTLQVVGISNNNLSLTFTGQVGITYVVEYATNLSPPITWQTAQSLTSTGGLIRLTDGNATNAARFYRARVP